MVQTAQNAPSLSCSHSEEHVYRTTKIKTVLIFSFNKLNFVQENSKTDITRQHKHGTKSDWNFEDVRKCTLSYRNNHKL